MNNEKFLMIAISIVIITALGLAGVMFKMIMENSQCLDHPFEYSAEKLEESGGLYDCYCDSRSPELLDFRFDKTGIQIEDPEIPLSYQDIKFRDIKIG